MSRALLLLVAASLGATDEPGQPLWPSTPPGETLHLPAGADPRGSIDKSGHLVQVFQPEIEWFPAKSEGAPLALVFPGGGYGVLAIEHEGRGVARRFQSLGCAAAVVRYRVPRRDPSRPWEVPLLDARQALVLARAHAGELHADPRKVVAIGFSAGGNLVARLAYQPAGGDVPRPDYAVMIYPAYLLASDATGPLRAGPDGVTPAPGSHPAPAFLAHSANDPIPAQGSLELAAALRVAGTTAETHVFAEGGHGWGVKGQCPASRVWPELVAEWLRGRGALR